MIPSVLVAMACTYGPVLPGPEPLAEDTTGLYVVVFNQSSKATELELLLDGTMVLDTVAEVATVSPAITIRRRYEPTPGIHTVEVRDVTRQRSATVQISVGQGRQANLHISMGERFWVEVVYGIQVYL
jgi:hypothetical protein